MLLRALVSIDLPLPHGSGNLRFRCVCCGYSTTSCLLACDDASASACLLDWPCMDRAFEACRTIPSKSCITRIQAMLSSPRASFCIKANRVHALMWHLLQGHEGCIRAHGQHCRQLHLLVGRPSHSQLSPSAVPAHTAKPLEQCPQASILYGNGWLPICWLLSGYILLTSCGYDTLCCGADLNG